MAFAPEEKKIQAVDAPYTQGMQFGLATAGPVCLLIIWQLVTMLDVVPRLLMPPPGTTLGRLWAMLQSGDLFPDIGASLYRWGAGYLLGCIVGVPMGLLIGTTRWLYQSSFFLLDFFRSLPVTALFPLFLLFFGIGDSAKIAMAFTATVFVVILNSAYGVQQAKKSRLRAAKVFGASPSQIFRLVVFFEALPQTLVGMRTSVSLALIVVIVSEMFIGTQLGLGQRVYDAYTRNLTEELYAVLVLTGILGYLINRLFIVAERRMTFWVGE